MYKTYQEKRIERVNSIILGTALGFTVTVCGIIYLVMEVIS
jgi:hypothetical protein